MVHEAPPGMTAGPVPRQPTEGEGRASTPERTEETPGAVPFDRLLSVAVLTPAQASIVAARLMGAAPRRRVADPDQPDTPCLGAVTLTRSGGVDVGTPQAGEGTPLTELLDQLVQNARRLPAHPKPEQLTLLHELEKATRHPLLEPEAAVRELERAVTDTLGPGAPERLAGQLAALVDAFALVTPGSPGAAAVPGPGRVANAAPAPAAAGAAPTAPALPRSAPGWSAWTPRGAGRPARPSRARIQPRRRGRRVALAVLVLAGVLVVSGYLVLRGQGGGVLGAFGLGTHPAAPATTAPAQPSTTPAPHKRHHRRQAVPTLARRHSGPITGVSVQKTARCAPGRLCPVKVTAHLRPSRTARTISWKVGAARLCTRGVTWSAHTTVTARAGWTTVYASSSVRVPKGRSLALVALTTTPARAQSRPVPVSGSALHC